jgi:phage gp36-like protein
VPYYSLRTNLGIDEQRLAELTDSEAAVGVVDEALVERFGIEADAEIDGLLAAKYVTPVAQPAPAILAVIHGDLWRFRIYGHRENMETPARIERDFQRSWSLLKSYARGDEWLAAARVQAPTSPTVGGGAFSSDSCERLFGRCKDGLG